MEQKRIDVGCYYFPNYHRNDERNAQVHGPGWSEGELVKQALPRSARPAAETRSAEI